MNADNANKHYEKQLSRKQGIVWSKLFRKVYTSRKLILIACGIGTILGLVIAFGTPKEYTAKIFIVPEGYNRNFSSGIDALSTMAGVGIDTKSSADRDAIFPSLYPAIINSTPFLIRLFDIKVRERKDTAVITLAQYIKERQKAPWWSIITSLPSRLIGWTKSLFFPSSNKSEMEKPKIKTKIDPFQLTREEAGVAGAIASKIEVGVDKKKRTITLFVTMQDPLVAATVADTVRGHLQEYVTEYRTNKSHKILKYNEKLCKEAQAEYYKAQDKYTRYADANQSLALLTSRAELSRLRSEMNLAYSTYNQMEIQVQAAKARVDKVTPVYTVIQPVTVPLSPSKPRIVLILAGCILLSAAGSIGWILFVKDFIKKLKTRIMMPVGK